MMETGVCDWAMKHAIEREYHDREWGRVNKSDRYLFEFLTLEGAQAGLSWYTILKRRDAYRLAFEEYDLSKLANFDEDHVEKIISTYDVIKHRGKISSVFNNARAAQVLINEYGSLANALWQFVDHQPVINYWESIDDIPTSTDVSKKMSRFLKKRGFKFVGETICYAFMQAVGMVNDHLVTCHCHQQVIEAQE
ncbi:DNA-3-methyladenine glycosidase [Photobacterium gaetbulicola]|uniref:DNA-3-methyladenine glycosylase I n=2 Tax=Photobacterium gaetbulicola TaxID=1295392 RepID=A0A0B9G420_9GAMM|nr:DNA-3-methyladenine glycosylase I [Photobacterium gaetbulicola]KHT63488.1 DNA-3-methyladenine glycosidase [Photobacterium gaetbulicola]